MLQLFWNAINFNRNQFYESWLSVKYITVQPGLASTEEDRSPTNLEIQVQFPTEADEFFFCAVAEKYVRYRSIQIILSSEKQKRHLLEKRKAVFTFFLW